MDVIKLTKNQPYIISLDSLDLQYIERNLQNTNNDIVPIWNKKSAETYYEFQVLEDKEANSENIKLDDKPDKFTCNICDIKVPNVFRKEHFESDKHKMFAKLTEVALTRVTKSLNCYEDIKTSAVPKNISYCAACCDTVYNKELHDNSKKHLKFTKFDETMKFLLNLYIDKNTIQCLDNIDIKLNKGKLIDKNGAACEMVKESLNIKTVRLESIAPVPLKSEVKFNPPLSNSQLKTSKSDLICKEPEIKKANETNELYSYLVSLAKKHGLILPKLNVEGDSVIIYSAKGETQKVTTENFHGFLKNSTGTCCKLCYEQLGVDISKHVGSKKHVTNIFKPLSEDFTRKMRDNLHHCVICNKLTSNVEFHRANDVQHKSRLESKSGLEIKSLSQPQSKGAVMKGNVEDGPNKKYCKVCNLFLHKNDFNSHILGYKHEQNLLLNAVTATETQPTPKNKTIDFDLPEFITARDKETYCTICSVNIPYTSKNVSEHINASKHKGNFEKFLEENKIALDSGCYKCVVCNSKVEELMKHTQSDAHLQSVKNLCVVPLESEVKLNPPLSKSPLKTSKSDLCEESEIKKANETNELYSYLVSLAKKHGLILPKLNVEGDSVIIYSAKGETQKVTTENFNGFHKNLNGTFCKLCDEQLGGDISEHVDSKIHVTNICKPLSEDFTRKMRDKLHHCVICNKLTSDAEFHREYYLQHKSTLESKSELEIKSLSQPQSIGAVMKGNVEDGPNKKYCKVCNLFLHKDDFNSHIVSYEHGQNQTLNAVTTTETQPTPKNKTIDFDLPDFITARDKETYCTICSVIISYNSKHVSEHINASKHKRNFEKFLEENKIALDSGCYKCIVCNSKIEELMKHTQSDAHLQSVKNLCVVPLESEVKLNPPLSKSQPKSSKSDLCEESEIKKANETNELYSYLVSLAKKHDLILPKLNVEGESVIIYSAKGETQKVPTENFHGFEKNYYGTFCKLCCEQLGEDISEHVETKIHVTNICKPLNEDFTRTMRDNFHHCVICNKLTMNEFHHANHVEHKQNLDLESKSGLEIKSLGQPQSKGAVIKSTVEDGPNDTYCKVCNLFLQKNDFNSHILGYKHEQNLLLNAITTTETQPTPKNKTIDFDLPDFITARDKETYCTICCVIIPSTSRNVSEHINASKHKRNLEKILEENKIVLDSGGYKCIVCNSKIEELMKHAQSDAHLQSVKNFCFVCNVKVPNKGMQVHELGKAHKDKLLASVTKPDVQNVIISKTKNLTNNSETNVVDENVIKFRTCLISQTKNEKQLLCRLCLTLIPNIQEHIKEHCEGKNHLKKYTTTLNINSIKENSHGYECEICSGDKIEDFFTHIQLDSHKRLVIKNIDLQTKETVSVARETCDICEKDVTGLKGHDEEFSHKVKLYGLLKHNKISENGTTEYSCGVCNELFSNNTLMVHINSKLHVDKIKHAKKSIQYNYCDLCEDTVDIDQHNSSLTHLARENEILKNNSIKISEHHYYCEPCEQIINKFNLILHIENPLHVKKLKKNNDDIKTEYCDVCNDIIKESDHDKNVAHIRKLNDLMKHHKISKSVELIYCNICDKIINDEGLIDHIRSQKHKAQNFNV